MEIQYIIVIFLKFLFALWGSHCDYLHQVSVSTYALKATNCNLTTMLNSGLIYGASCRESVVFFSDT
jgi:hypothetical protein